MMNATAFVVGIFTRPTRGLIRTRQADIVAGRFQLRERDASGVGGSCCAKLPESAALSALYYYVGHFTPHVYPPDVFGVGGRGLNLEPPSQTPKQNQADVRSQPQFLHQLVASRTP